MKKNLKISLVGAAMALASCTPPSFQLARTEIATAEISQINIEVNDLAIKVAPSQDEHIALVYYESETHKLTKALADGVLRLGVDNSADSFFGLQADLEYRTLSIFIPAESELSLSVITSNEDIEVADLRFVNLNLENNNGDIAFRNIPTSQNATFINKNGDITGNIIGSYDDYAIESEAKKGETNLPSSKNEGSKRLRAYNNNGDIDITISPLAQ